MLNAIRKYLENKEWEFEALENQISTSFRTELDDNSDHVFSLYFTIVDDVNGEKYVRMTIAPLIELPADGYPSDLYEHIAMINHDLAKAKFSIDADGDLELIIDLPATISNSDLDKAVSLLAELSGAYFQEISDLIKKE